MFGNIRPRCIDNGKSLLSQIDEGRKEIEYCRDLQSDHLVAKNAMQSTSAAKIFSLSCDYA